MIVAAAVLFSTLGEYSKTQDLYTETEEEYVTISDDIEKEANFSDANSSGEIIDTIDTQDSWWSKATVDLDGLATQNSDIVGWIFFENEKISYPILYSGDNTKYLHTTYTGETAKAGSIFLDGESTPDFSDLHSLLYGHNMRDLSMFGRLKYYKTNKDYFDSHQYFQVFTSDKVYRYKVFAYEDVSDNNDIYYAYGADQDSDSIENLMNTIKKGSYVKSNYEVDGQDRFLTLSTCTADDTQRLVVCAVCEDEHVYAN